VLAENGHSSTRNAALSAIQQIILTINLIILLNIIIDQLGTDLLGVWSLVLASTSVSRVANFGLASGVTRFVTDHRARLEDIEIPASVSTSLYGVLILVMVVGGIVYLPARIWIGSILDGEYAQIGIAILPVGIGSAVLASTSSVLTATLEAYERVDLRVLIVATSNVIFVVVSALLIGPFGLMGLAFAQLLQYGIILISAGAAVTGLAGTEAIMPHSVSLGRLNEMKGYTAGIQACSIMQIFYDPAIKTMISIFGGIAAVGTYEIAARVLLQAHNFVAAAYVGFLPSLMVADSSDPRMASKYRQGSGVLAKVAAIGLVFVGVATARSIAASVDIQNFGEFYLYVTMLALGFAANVWSFPAYFSNLSTMRVTRNVVAVALRLILIILLGLAFGRVGDSRGVAAAWAVAAMASAALLQWLYRSDAGSDVEVSPKTPVAYIVLALAGCAAAFIVNGLVVSPVRSLLLSLVLGGCPLIVAVLKVPQIGVVMNSVAMRLKTTNSRE